MPGDNKIVTENFLNTNFTEDNGITPGTNDLLGMDCNQVKARYQVDVTGVTTTGLRLPSQNQITSSVPLAASYIDLKATLYETSISISATIYSIGDGILGDPSVTNKGFVYSTTSPPTFENGASIIYEDIDFIGNDVKFSATITGLTEGVKYYIRSYTINPSGISYGFTRYNHPTWGWLYDGGGLAVVPNNYVVGVTLQGGTLAYLFYDSAGFTQNLPQGIIVATADLGLHPWDNNGWSDAHWSGWSTSKKNTDNIISHSSNINGAAHVCVAAVINGYDDWLLPSETAINLITNAGFLPAGDVYWSSTEYTDFWYNWTHAFARSTVDSNENQDKPNNHRVLPCRHISYVTEDSEYNYNTVELKRDNIETTDTYHRVRYRLELQGINTTGASSNFTITRTDDTDGIGNIAEVISIASLDWTTIWYVNYNRISTDYTATAYISAIPDTGYTDASSSRSSTIPALATATLSQSPSMGSLQATIIYTITLSTTSAIDKVFSVTHTDVAGTGTTTENITVTAGQLTGSITEYCNRRTVSYDATCYTNGTVSGYYINSGTMSYTVIPLIAATLTVDLVSQTSTVTTLRYTITLNSVAVNNASFDITHANSNNNNSATQTIVIPTSSTSYYIDYAYNRLGGYVAGCNITLTPSGYYDTGATAGYTIPAGIYVPTVTTNDASVYYSQLTLGGNVSSDGGATVTSRGVYYAPFSNPYSGLSIGTGTGNFSDNTSSVFSSTTYYYKAYATNSAGTGFGEEKSIITPNPPTVSSTTAASSITQTTASTGGDVTSDGGQGITARGVAYALSSVTTTPTTSDSTVTASNSTGTFTSSLTGLTAGTSYHVRAYASNYFGTTYGSAISFTTASASITASISRSTTSSQQYNQTERWRVTLSSNAPSNVTFTLTFTYSGSQMGPLSQDLTINSGTNTNYFDLTYGRAGGYTITGYMPVTPPAGYVTGTSSAAIFIAA